MSLLARPWGGKMRDPGKEVVKDTHLITNSSFIFNQVLPVCFVLLLFCEVVTCRAEYYYYAEICCDCSMKVQRLLTYFM